MTATSLDTDVPAPVAGGVRRWTSGRRGWAVGGALVAVAAVFAALSAVSSYDAGHSDAARFAADRDQALAAGRQEIATLDSMDYRHADAGLRAWLAASTGPLHDELQRSQAQSTKQIQQGRTVAVGQVVDAAVTELDDRAGTAQVIASVRIVLTPGGGTASTQRNRYQAGLTRTGDGWRLSSLTAIPVSAT
jgi:Mce-associated membrane protein